MRFPAYGKRLWDRRLSGERPRVVALLVGDFWKAPKWLPAAIPRLAVKNAAWHLPTVERYDWRLVTACSVLAIDLRLPGEPISGPDEWDAWFWLLADVQQFARDVQLLTPRLDFEDPPDAFAAERDLATYAWCNRSFKHDSAGWPPWWPYGDTIFARDRRAAA